MELCQRLISTLLEIALLPDDSLRELIIPVFCDMFLTSQQANTNSIDIDCAENFMSAFILELDSLMDSVAFDVSVFTFFHRYWYYDNAFSYIIVYGKNNFGFNKFVLL